MAPDDRDRTFEKALSRHLHPGASQPACLDAEVLAAYHDQLLSPQQMLSIEQHIATCPSCAEILAQLAATDDLPVDDSLADTDAHEHVPQNILTMPAPHGTPELVPALSESAPAEPVSLPSRAARVAQSSWRSRTLHGANWRFLAPAGVLAAVLLIWVAFHESRPPEFQLAKNSQPPSALPSSPKPATPPPVRIEETKEAGNYAVAPPPSSGARSSGGAGDASSGYQNKKSEQPAELDKSAPPAAASKSSLSALSPGVAGNAPRKPAASSAGAVAVPEIVSSTAPRDATEPRSDVSATVQHDSKMQQVIVTNDAVAQSQVAGEVQNKDLPANEIPATASQSQREQSARAKNKVAPVATQAQQLQTDTSAVSSTVTSQSAPTMHLAKSIAPNTVSSPDSAIQWRFSSAGLIEHSINAGATWSVQPSGVITDLLAASAPSTKVCWIVGREATIIRTTDAGTHWTKLPAPAQSDIIAIFAVNKNQATVTTTTHQTYTTNDAAKTWTPTPNP